MSELDPKETAAVRKLIRSLAGFEAHEDADILDCVTEIVRQWDETQDRLAHLEDRVARLESMIEDTDTKLGKVQAIVEYAENRRRDDQPLVEVTPEEIRGATGVSNRYSYTLTHPEKGLPADYEWIIAEENVTQYGDLQISKDETDPRTIAIDFAGVQSEGCPLNKFISPPQGEGGSETAEEGS